MTSGCPEMTDFPRSLLEFQQRFPDEDACAAYLATLRWPAGFVCPACGGSRGWALATKAHTHECADCRKQTSVTAGTVMHGSKLALTAWFWAAYLMATHSNGISALQLQKQLGLGSYKTAWLLTTKLRRAMVAPERMPLAGLVEVDVSLISCCSKDRRLGRLPRRVRRHTRPPRRWKHGRPCRPALGSSRLRQPQDLGRLGVYHGLRRQHLQSYLDEFVFRFNRRRSRHAAFRSILGIGVAIKPATYKMLIAPEVQG